MSTDHLAKAKEYIAKGDDFYAKAADEIIVAQKEDSTLSNYEIARRLGRNESWVRKLVQSRTNAPRAAHLDVDWQSGDRDEAGARKVLRDPEQRKQVISSMPTEALDQLQRDATDAVVSRARAQRAEHQTEPTTNEIMGDAERFDPAEYWADTLVIRVNRNARELAKHISQAGGLLFGSMTPGEAFDYLHEAERLIAETRAAAQEQVRDRSEV